MFAAEAAAIPSAAPTIAVRTDFMVVTTPKVQAIVSRRSDIVPGPQSVPHPSAEYCRPDDTRAPCPTARYRPSARIKSAARNPIIIAGPLVLPDTSVGMIDVSATRSPSTPRTRSLGSTTAVGSTPMRAVPAV